jgi:hypothetical protein
MNEETKTEVELKIKQMQKKLDIALITIKQANELVKEIGNEGDYPAEPSEK